ncbi:MAG: 4'-phosphopantetheinyl transferase superfamily protein [Cellvibrio sp.]|uniref:4'-phosphopantetheinyl transferase family protein n=1 Tax=Cellvibrio sp. TaxID=1965322 RepID=UPI0027280F8E|nr:4'-phosphopantetheinyl transferase superfamily protein [Cellvibrio sp.]
MCAFIANQTNLMTLSLKPLPAPMFSQPEQDRALGAQNLHIHCLDIRRFTADHYADADCIMSPAERERAQKFVRGKESYVASRWLLRKVLARYTGTASQAIEFLRTDKGKPYLPQSDIHFSLSHSGDWALIAVGKAELIGVDIEVVSAMRDLCGIAESYYHPQEFARLQELKDEDQAEYFYRLWTLKEAFFKAIGTGISAGLEKIAFEFEDNKLEGNRLEGNTISAQIAAELCRDADEWQFHQWALTAQVYCALASQSEYPLEVSWFDALSAPAFS